MRKSKLYGRFDSQEVAEAPKFHPNVEVKQGTFRITVKDDEDEVKYTNENEPYEYPQVPSLETALEHFGASLSEDQKQFLSEALKGDTLGPAVKAIVDLINDDLRTTAKNNAYQRVFNTHKPLSEENIGNATASIVRNFMKLNNVSDETALSTLQGYGVVPKEFTLDQFRGNKGKR
jgi:hypothetical protein